MVNPDALVPRSAPTDGPENHSPLQPRADQVLDTRGLNCPEPVMLLHRIVRRAQPGETIYVQASDPSTTRDIPKFCQHLGHHLLAMQQDHPQLADATYFEYWIRKRDP